MRKIIFSFLILFAIGIVKVKAQESEASNEILSKIVKAENALKEEKQFNQGDLHEIVCLTNIETEKGDGNYLGISFYPSENEIQQWKDWFEKNKTKINYSSSSDAFNKEYYNGKRKVIQVEYESGKYRNTVCDEDKKIQEWLKNQNTKN